MPHSRKKKEIINIEQKEEIINLPIKKVKKESVKFFNKFNKLFSNLKFDDILLIGIIILLLEESVEDDFLIIMLIIIFLADLE